MGKFRRSPKDAMDDDASRQIEQLKTNIQKVARSRLETFDKIVFHQNATFDIA
ncbi:MAG: hypothetical protein LBQ23_01225 [Puniceicoccales bacterium]|jgi:hypothetical protein|nr:hypothetical protein [Puniceicoccales bacterium]